MIGALALPRVLMARLPHGRLTKLVATVAVGTLIVGGASQIPGVVGTPTSPSGVDIWIATNGNDSTCVRDDQSFPCLSMDGAYQIAQCGDQVEMAAGTYDWQVMTENASLVNCSSDITFSPASGATVTLGTDGSTENRSLKFGSGFNVYNTDAPDHIVINDLNMAGGIEVWGDIDGLVLDGVDSGGVLIEGAQNITVRNSDLGPCNSSGAGKCSRNFILDTRNSGTPPTQNILFENNVVHDFIITDPADHWECFFIKGGTNVTLRGNIIYNCDTNGMAIGAGTGAYENWIIENNWFGNTCCFGGMRTTGGTERGTAVNITDDEDIVLRYNSFSAGETFVQESGAALTSVRVYGNIFGDTPNCVAGADYDYNLFLGGNTCGTNATAIGSLPYENTDDAGSMDFHLSGAAGSTTADNYVVPNTGDYASTLDIDNDTRPHDSTTRDAGADER